MFNKKLKVKNLVLTTGTILLEGTSHTQVYKVLKCAQNVNYNSIAKKIEVGDLVVCSEWMHNNSFKLDGKTYYIITPKRIKGYFQ